MSFSQAWSHTFPNCDAPSTTTLLVTSAVGVATLAVLTRPLWKGRALRRQLRRELELKQERRKAQFSELRREYGELTPGDQNILNLNWDQLRNKLQSRELSAVAVLRAFTIKSLEHAGEGCNAVTEYNPKAMNIARELDALPKPKGPLHGLPFCVKDDFNLEGLDTTLGFAKNCNKPARKTAALVLVLKELGGIPMLKTNVPQTLLTIGSDNPVFGQTTNAHNRKLAPGGSSSGTGALVGSGGVFFGTGSDVGGSVRNPAHLNGISALKPTSRRLTDKDLEAVLENLVGIDIVTGILGKNAHVVSSIIQYILETNLQSKFDPTIIPLKWNHEVFTSKSKLRIGYFHSVPFFPSIGDTPATILRAVSTLEARGHQLIPIKIPDGEKIIKAAANFIFADQNKSVTKLWESEEIAKCMQLNHFMLKLPKWVIKLLRFLMQRKTLLPFMYTKSLASMLGAGSETAVDLWDNKGLQSEIKDEILAEFKKYKLDACICPILPFPALPVDIMGRVAVGTVYSIVWNLVDFPAGVVKFGEETTTNVQNYDDQGDQTLRLAKEACKQSKKAPIGVQVVGLPYCEEMVCRVMTELEDSRPTY